MGLQPHTAVPHLVLELVVPVRPSVAVARLRTAQLLRRPGRAVHLPYRVPAQLAVLALVLDGSGLEGVDHTSTHTDTVHTDLHRLSHSPVGVLVRQPLSDAHDLLSGVDGVHAPPVVLNPAQTPTASGHHRLVLAVTGHVHAQCQGSLSSNVLVSIDESSGK